MYKIHAVDLFFLILALGAAISMVIYAIKG